MIRNGFAWATCVFVALAGTTIASADAGSHGFIVDVTLSTKAAALLRDRKEAIVVAAMYEGNPIPARQKYAGEDGLLGLGSEDVILPAAGGRATITGNKVKRDRIGWVERFDVLVNVYSARRSSQDNLLDCGIFEDSVAKAHAAPIHISCKLIEGE
jgi:hypothetical protein